MTVGSAPRFAGTNTPIAVELLFTANDAGDNIYDTHVLVDNIRFSTVWVDAKIVAGAARSAGGIEQEVQSANEILSQAGINVRLRNVQTTSADTLLDTDITFDEDCRFLFLFNCKFVRTEDETVLLSLIRSSTAADVNVYYVQLMSENNTPGTAAALAIGPDDYHDVGFLTNAGVIIQDLDQGGCPAGGQIIAHELGHLLISPQRAGDALEHAAGTNNFMGGNCATPLIGLITRAQSANINRVGAPLLRP